MQNLINFVASDPDTSEADRLRPGQNAALKRLVERSKLYESDGLGVQAVYVHMNSEDVSDGSEILSEGINPVFYSNAVVDSTFLPKNLFGGVMVVKARNPNNVSKTEIQNVNLLDVVKKSSGNPVCLRCINTASSASGDSQEWEEELGPGNSWAGVYSKKSARTGMQKFVIVVKCEHDLLSSEFLAMLKSLGEEATAGKVADSLAHTSALKFAYRNIARIAYNISAATGLEIDYEDDQCARIDPGMIRPRMAKPYTYNCYNYFQRQNNTFGKTVQFMNKTTHIDSNFKGLALLLSPRHGINLFRVKDQRATNMYKVTLDMNRAAHALPVCMGRAKHKSEYKKNNLSKQKHLEALKTKLRKVFSWDKKQEGVFDDRVLDSTYRELTPARLETLKKILALPDKQYHLRPVHVRI